MKSIRLNNIIANEHATIVEGFGYIIPNPTEKFSNFSYEIRDGLRILGINPSEDALLVNLEFGGFKSPRWTRCNDWWIQEKVTAYRKVPSRYLMVFPNWFPKELFRDVKEGDIVEIVSPNGGSILRMKMEQLSCKYSFDKFENLLKEL